MVEELVVSNEHVIIAGDVNIHVETADLYAQQFDDLLDLKQHVAKPTHTKGHTLDVILTPNMKNHLHEIAMSTNDLSDRVLVDFMLNFERKLKQTKVINNHPTKAGNMEQYQDFTAKLGAMPPTNNVGKRVDIYNGVLKNIVDEYLPMKTAATIIYRYLKHLGSTRIILISGNNLGLLNRDAGDQIVRLANEWTLHYRSKQLKSLMRKRRIM